MARRAGIVPEVIRRSDGPSWEGMAIENLLAAAGAGAPHQVQGSFYRTSHGAEVDLVLSWPDGEEWAIEIKRSLSPTPERGFHSALTDLAPRRALIVYPGTESYRLKPPVQAIGLAELCKQAQARSDSLPRS
jgi:predicted AAA+ superfamily ATPase